MSIVLIQSMNVGNEKLSFPLLLRYSKTLQHGKRRRASLPWEKFGDSQQLYRVKFLSDDDSWQA